MGTVLIGIWKHQYLEALQNMSLLQINFGAIHQFTSSLTNSIYYGSCPSWNLLISTFERIPN